MTNNQFIALKRPYVLSGILAAMVIFIFMQFNVINSMIPRSTLFIWQVVSGTILIILVLYQLSLLVFRVIGVKSQFHYKSHRWVGVLSTILFALHAVRFGYAWTNMLAILFCLSALTGLLNREVIGYKSNWTYKAWYCLHIAISVNLIPLIAVHVWVALLFEGR